MRRVRVIAFIYGIIESPVAGAVGLLVLILSAGMIVSLGHVESNILAQGDWSSRFSYALISFEHTRVIVQIIAAGIVLLGSYILVNSVRTIRRSGFFSLFMLRRAG